MKEKKSLISNNTLYVIIIGFIFLSIIIVAEGFFYIKLQERYIDLVSSHQELSDELNDLQNIYAELNQSFDFLNDMYIQLLSRCDNLTEYGDINVHQAKNLIETRPNLIVVDVRTPSEYGTGHIEESINLCYSCSIENLLNNLNPEDEILLYCLSGFRSANAMIILNENGYTKVFNMVGGILAWIEADYPINI